MKKNWKVLLFAAIILFVLVGFTVLSSLSEKIPSNDISVTGNTAGNLNNGGLFAESNGKVFFANAYDNGCLYSMNADETDLQKLNEAQTSAINTGGDFIYYYMDSQQGGGTGMGYVVRTASIEPEQTAPTQNVLTATPPSLCSLQATIFIISVIITPISPSCTKLERISPKIPLCPRISSLLRHVTTAQSTLAVPAKIIISMPLTPEQTLSLPFLKGIYAFLFIMQAIFITWTSLPTTACAVIPFPITQ